MMLCGWINLYKPMGCSSFDLVKQVRRLFPRGTKIGHGGTLDPLAQGVLPIAVGEATKTTAYLINEIKGYQFEVTWGEERDTDDMEGQVLQSSDYCPSQKEIMAIMPNFMGDIEQLPPLYSAKKIQGQRACDRVRQGQQNITLSKVPVHIYCFELISHEGSNHRCKTTFYMECSKGTYVRAVARDLGRALSCYGFASKIVRTKVGRMTLQNSVAIEKLALCEKNVIVSEIMTPLQAVLADIPAVVVTFDQEECLRKGQTVVLAEGLLDNKWTTQKNFYVLCLSQNQDPVAIGYVHERVIQPKRIFNMG